MTTENKAIDDLLKPRYKVIADYPDNEFAVGEILPDEVVSNEEDEILKYPHLFKKLEWWEERQESEMPEYVVMNHNNGRIYKVSKHFVSALHGLGFINERGKIKSYCNYLPATEAEYLNQKQQGHE